MSALDARTIEPDDTGVAPDTAPNVTRTRDGGRSVITKTARGRWRPLLRRESEILRRVRLPGMVELIEVVEEDDTTTLVMEDAGRTTLADPVGLSRAEQLRALRRCCGAVHELHTAGWTHGAIHSDHVVVGRRGSIRLCSFGAAQQIEGSDRSAVDVDLVQLLDVIDHAATLSSPDSSLRGRAGWWLQSRRVRRIANTARERLTQDEQLTAADLAVALSMAGAPRHLRHGATQRQPRRWAPIAGLGVMGVVLTGLFLGLGTTGGDGFDSIDVSDVLSRSGDRPTTPTTSGSAAPSVPNAPPATDRMRSPARCGGWPAVGYDVDGDSCPERIWIDGNVVVVGDRSYRLGDEGDLVAIGDWDCDGRSTARLLRPSTGELFEFPAWASPSSTSEAFRLTTLEAAAGLRSVPVAGPGGAQRCDRMLVTGRDGSVVEPAPLTLKDTP